MLDFNLLNDPERQAKRRAEREKEEAAQEALEKQHQAALDTCLRAYDSLTEKERSLVCSCRTRLNTYLPLSDGQAAWLLDIAARHGFQSSGSDKEVRDE